MKAAMIMLNPFGNDDDDFEVDYLIDRHQIFTGVVLDDCFDVAPTPHDIEYTPLPQTKTIQQNKNYPLVGSAANLKVNRFEEATNVV